MPSHQALKDDQLLAEMYSGMAGGALLLETPATAANIEKFMKKYFSWASPDNTQINNLRNHAKETLEVWTPRLQQVIKAAGGNPDIFAYPSLTELEQVIANSQVSKTDQKKAYKTATDADMPLVLETDKYLVYQPKTWEASRKYFGINRISLLDGTQKKGAKWCTSAAESPEHFNDYVVKRGDRLLYFIRKKDDRLFAARSRKTTDQNYGVWLRNIQPILKKITNMTSGDEYTQLQAKVKKARSKKYDETLNGADYSAIYEYEKIQRDVRKLFMELQPDAILELRAQKNESMWRTLTLLEVLNNRPPNLEEYLAFIRFVVYNKTS